MAVIHYSPMIDSRLDMKAIEDANIRLLRMNRIANDTDEHHSTCKMNVEKPSVCINLQSM